MPASSLLVLQPSSRGRTVASLLLAGRGSIRAQLVWLGMLYYALYNTGFMFLLAATLGVMWIGQCLVFVSSGRIPQIVTDSGHVTNLVAALDLSMIVPPLVIGGIELWHSRAWGYVLAGGLLVQCLVTTVVLIVGAPVQAAAGIQGAWALEPLWAVLGVGCLISTALLLPVPKPAAASHSRGAA